MKKNNILVVKIGSSVIAPKGKLDSRVVAQLVKDIRDVEDKGYKVIMVSSGAIACGLNKLGYKKRPDDMHVLMAISSLGQILLMDMFNKNFKRYDKVCAQLLLTRDDFNERKRFMNIKKTIDKLISMNIVPIINENDAVAHEEIGVGDNDMLSELVADLAGAEKLILLSDVDGLLDKDKKVIPEISLHNQDLDSLNFESRSIHTKGGLRTKLEAATRANLSGIKTWLAYGRKKDVISKIIDGERIGTLFIPAEQVERSRKRWIHSKKIKGAIWIDDGAKKALVERGKSLLGVGITQISKGFRKGDRALVCGQDRKVIGSGIVNYDWETINKAKKKNVRLEKEVIHRDNFAKLAQGWKYDPHRDISRIPKYGTINLKDKNE